MKTFCCAILILFTSASVSAQRTDALDAMIEKELASLVSIYKKLHASPELSFYEQKTAAFLAKELKGLGYSVTENVGKYENPELKSYGLVAVMKNGSGPTVLVRTDMDGLPVEEKTGLPYASKAKMRNTAGQEVSVMHACGHDVHMATLLGVAKMLALSKDRWSGTVLLIGQPAEETISGARAMLRDGLYERFSKPDFVIALHDSADIEAGKVGYTPGYALASSNSVDVIVRGLGGHGSRPESTKDPIVIAAEIILALQTIVSREVSPLDPAVVTVGSIQGGFKHNIIPDEVHLQLTVRAYKEEVRQKILQSIERISKNIALAAGVPEDRLPIVDISKTENVPATYNNPELTERLANVFRQALGEENVLQFPPIMASEDFGYFSLNNQIPATLLWLGAVDPAKVKESRESGKPLPSLHSPLFAPVPEPTIRTGVKAMTSAVLELLEKK